jgi:hypothetical protein
LCVCFVQSHGGAVLSTKCYYERLRENWMFIRVKDAYRNRQENLLIFDSFVCCCILLNCSYAFSSAGPRWYVFMAAISPRNCTFIGKNLTDSREISNTTGGYIMLSDPLGSCRHTTSLVLKLKKVKGKLSRENLDFVKKGQT